MAGFSRSATAKSFPALPYEQMKNDVLGTSYSLSLVFVGERRAQALNKKHRNKEYVPNVLSFPLDAAHGEVFIAPAVAKREAKNFGMTYRGYVGFLFIHALLHLKGMRHGATMERAEKRYCARYNLS